jgi:hypothetical protein
MAEICKGIILLLKTMLHLMELNPDFTYMTCINYAVSCYIISKIVHINIVLVMICVFYFKYFSVTQYDAHSVINFEKIGPYLQQVNIKTNEVRKIENKAFCLLSS